MKQNVAHVIL